MCLYFIIYRAVIQSFTFDFVENKRNQPDGIDDFQFMLVLCKSGDMTDFSGKKYVSKNLLSNPIYFINRYTNINRL